MAIYKLKQENRSNSQYQGKWYARATHDAKVITTNDVARRIQQNVSVKMSDVLAVLAELSEVVNLYLIEGKKVKINGFGLFKVGLASTPADSAKDFTPAKNIKGSHIVFMPELDETRTDAQDRKSKTLLKGLRWAEDNTYNVDKSDAGNTGGNTGGNSGGSNTDPQMP